MPALPRPAVTTTDWLKAFGLLLVTVDHVGLFLLPEQDWWRVFGRLAAPIFFFLIGFARSREVPWTWFVLGLSLTGLDLLTSRSSADVQLNLLLSFALLRAARPAFDRHVAPVPARMALAAGIGVGLIPVLAPYLEYGAEGWLWALFGLSLRDRIDRPALPGRTAVAFLVAATAASAYWATETRDYGFDRLESTTLAGLIGSLTVFLWAFRRIDGDGSGLPGWAARALRLAGTRSLEIYGISLFLMQLLGYVLHGPFGEDTDDADES